MNNARISTILKKKSVYVNLSICHEKPAQQRTYTVSKSTDQHGYTAEVHLFLKINFCQPSRTAIKYLLQERHSRNLTEACSIIHKKTFLLYTEIILLNVKHFRKQLSLTLTSESMTFHHNN